MLVLLTARALTERGAFGRVSSRMPKVSTPSHSYLPVHSSEICNHILFRLERVCLSSVVESTDLSSVVLVPRRAAGTPAGAAF